MRLLLIHSDYIEYEAKKKTKMAEECSVPSDRMEDALTVFCAVESIDEEDLEGVILQAESGKLIRPAGQVRTDKILMYPYAHLSSDLASPETAIKVLNALQMPGSKRKGLPSSAHRSAGTSLSSLVQGPPALGTLQTIVPGEEGAVKKEKRRLPMTGSC